MRRIFIFMTGLFLFISTLSAQEDGLAVRRFGLFVASNDGGSDRQRLLYADDDVTTLARTMTELGGVSPQDEILLFEPSAADLDAALASLRQEVGSTVDARRVEVMFYYSGHSDETGLMLGDDRYPYGHLRDGLNDVDADVLIAILDSCASGAFTRDKGGIRRSPFLVDDSSSMVGHAFLTSSSADEVSQESDAVGGSFFTHYLVSGLRGAADTTRDGRVTLNEIYQHTYAETLARTELTLGGPQHPAHEIRLTGTGDLVLTDLQQPTASVTLGESLEGRVALRDETGRLVAEINKRDAEEVSLALPSGTYAVALQNGDQTLVGEIVLSRGQSATLERSALSRVRTEFARFRGDEDEPDVEREELAFSLGLVSRVSIPQASDATVNIMLGVLMADAWGVDGVQVSTLFSTAYGAVDGVQLAGIGSVSQGLVSGVQAGGIWSSADGPVEGVQLGGIFTSAAGPLTGFQGAGIFSSASGSVGGFQGSGIFSVAEGALRGVQASGIFSVAEGAVVGGQASGIFNVAEGDLEGAQLAGIFNISEGNLQGIQAAGIFNRAHNVNGVQVGLVNVSQSSRGLLIGLVNVSDDMRAFPLGLINISKEGIHDVDFRYEQGGHKYLSLRTGNRYYYTRFLLGIQEWNVVENPETFVFGFGVGFRATFRPLYAEVELDFRTALEDYAAFSSMYDAVNSFLAVPTLNLTLGLGRNLGIYGGVGFSLLTPWQNRESVLQQGGTRWDWTPDGRWGAEIKWYAGVHL